PSALAVLRLSNEFRTLSAPTPAAPTPYSLRSSWLAVILLYILGISRPAASVVDSMSRCKSSGNSDNTVGAAFFPSPPLPSLSRTATRNSNASFDHLVGDGEHFVGNLEPKCLGGLEIDDEIEFDRLLDRQIAGFRALQNFVHIGRGTAKQVRSICSISH